MKASAIWGLVLLACGLVVVWFVRDRVAEMPGPPLHVTALCHFDGPTRPGQAVRASTTVAGSCSTSGSGRAVGVVSERGGITLPPGVAAIMIGGCVYTPEGVRIIDADARKEPCP